jgi:hypothetical protein
VLVKSAVIGTLLSAGRPMSIAEITEAMSAVRPIEMLAGPMTPKRISDVLRFQSRRGLVRRRSRGCYEAVPEQMGRTTRWRYRRWDRSFDAELELSRRRTVPGRDA